MTDIRSDPVPDTRETDGNANHGSLKLTVAVFSLVTTVVLTAVKLGLGVLTGSLGLMADGLQGLMDVMVTAVTVLFVILAARGACPTWTTGREKLEALAALIEAALLGVIAVCIWYLALQKFLFAHHVAVIEAWHLTVVIIAIAADYGRALIVGRVAQTTGSLALEANAAHFRTDSLGSLVVLGGIWLAHLGWQVADSLATLGLAAILTWTAWRIGHRGGRMLLDIADPAHSEAVLEVLSADPRVLDVPVLRLHRQSFGYVVVAEILLPPGGLAGFGPLRDDLAARVAEVLPHSTLLLAPVEARAEVPPPC